MKLADIREYVFPLFVADDPARHPPGTAILVDQANYLGTAFFVSKNGIALTAAHCTPDPAKLPDGKAFVAAIWDGQRARVSTIQLATVLDAQDLAVLKLAQSSAKYLPLSFERTHMGEDVTAVGVPLHSVSGEAFEYRCLKGHVTFVSKTLELSFPAPRGMSGSPILKDGRVVGVLSWNARAEALEDQSDEVVEKFGPLTKVTKTVTMAVTNYGQAEPLNQLEEGCLSALRRSCFPRTSRQDEPRAMMPNTVVNLTLYGSQGVAAPDARGVMPSAASRHLPPRAG